MTERIREFLRRRREDEPCLVVDLDVVRENYNAFAKALPDSRVFYAVKANPAPTRKWRSMCSTMPTASVSRRAACRFMSARSGAGSRRGTNRKAKPAVKAREVLP